MAHLTRAPGRELALASLGYENLWKLWAYAMQANQGDAEKPFQPDQNDHRFTHSGWDKGPYAVWQQGFLATQDWWNHALSGPRGTRPNNLERVNFMVRQILDTVSPSNFPLTNPEVIDQARETKGQSLATGAQHLLQDLAKVAAHDTTPAPHPGLQVGQDIAATPGKVVFRNELFELLQYSPQSAKTHPEPILIVPAWIMKYYILDLSAQNSMINYLVQQGFTVFCISWCNPDASYRDYGLDAYRKCGVMEALDQISAIIPNQKIHTCGYCLGGTILSITAATMARDHDDRVASVTLLAAQTDFSEAGELLLFLDESQIAFLEDMMWEQGYLDQKQMVGAFQALRAEDLIWTRAVRRYLLGIKERDSDIAVWNEDATRMPYRMHSEYLRSLFMENRLTAGRFAVDGQVIALKDIQAPLFVVGTEKDHIAPWKSVYKVKLFTETDMRFVLTKGGHNGGIVSEPGHRNRHYRIGHRPKGALYMDPDSWLAQHQPKDGSWWQEWSKWLSENSSPKAKPPAMGPNPKGQKSACPAPGTYVFQR